MEIDEQPPPLVPQKSRWPKVIAIIALVFGGLNLLGAVLSPLLNAFQANQFDALEAAGVELREGFIEEYDSMILTQSVTGGILAAIMIVGGVMLLKRKSLGPLVLKIWASLQVLIGGFVMFKFQPVNKEFLEANTKSSFAELGPEGEQMAETIVNASYLFGIVVGVFFLLAFPVFLFIWFSRAKIKKEIASWKENSAAA